MSEELTKASTRSEQETQVIKDRIEEYKAYLKDLEAEKEIRQQAFEMQKKYPKPVNPHYEFETKEEWIPHLIKEWTHTYNNKMAGIEAGLERYQKLIDEMEKELEE